MLRLSFLSRLSSASLLQGTKASRWEYTSERTFAGCSWTCSSILNEKKMINNKKQWTFEDNSWMRTCWDFTYSSKILFISSVKNFFLPSWSNCLDAWVKKNIIKKTSGCAGKWYLKNGLWSVFKSGFVGVLFALLLSMHWPPVKTYRLMHNILNLDVMQFI